MDEGSRDLRQRQGGLSVGLPPAPVLAVTGIVIFFLYLSWRTDEYEEQLRRRTQAGLWVLLVLGLLALAVLAHHALVVVPVSWRGQQLVGGGDQEGGTAPWGVAAVVALLLLLASHKSSFQMFGPPWRYK